MAVAILSLPSGIDFSEYIPEYKEIHEMHNTPSIRFSSDLPDTDGSKVLKIMHVDSNLNLEAMETSNASINMPQLGLLKRRKIIET